MAEGTQPPVGTRSPPPVATPQTQDQHTKALEDAINLIHTSFKEEIEGIHNALRTLDTAQHAGNNRLGNENAGRVRGAQGHYDNHRGIRDQAFDNQDPVKAIGDVRRTMHAICQIPKLSHATLSDFDQWKQEMFNTIESARTNDPEIQQGQHRVHLRLHRPLTSDTKQWDTSRPR